MAADPERQFHVLASPNIHEIIIRPDVVEKIAVNGEESTADYRCAVRQNKQQSVKVMQSVVVELMKMINNSNNGFCAEGC